MSFFDTKTLTAKLNRLDQLEKTNQLRLKKIQNTSNIKLDRDQYLRYKEILYNYSTEKSRKQKPQVPPSAKSNENENTLNMPKQISAQNSRVSLEKDYQSPQNFYEFPVQMSSTNSGNSKELRDSYYENSLKVFDSESHSGRKDPYGDSENVIVLDEMNPNLSFSSCPLSENRAQPLKAKHENYQTHKDAIRTEDNLSPESSEKKKQRKIIAYGGEVIEYSDSEENESGRESPGFRKSDKKSHNQYRKDNAGKENVNKEAAGFSYRSDKDEDRIQKEFASLLDQKKALEGQIMELRKMQETTEKSSPFKRRGGEKRTSEDKGGKFPVVKTSEAIRDSYLDFQRKWEQLEALQPKEEREENEKIGREMKNKLEMEELEQEEEIVRTRRMKEDEWRPRRQGLDTKKKFRKEDKDEYERDYDNVDENDYRSVYREKDNALRVREENGRREHLKEWVDEIAADIDDLRRNKLNDTPDFKKKGNLFDSDGGPSSRSWGSRGSNGKELRMILEQISDGEE